MSELIKQQKVSGAVTDSSTMEPLPGVYVLVEGTQQGVVTDASGKYSLSIPAENAVLVFTYIGYLTQRVPVAGKSVINVNLSPDVKSLEEVVVVGYGTQKKSLVTGAISSIKETELSRVSLTGVDQALQGRLAGVYVSSNSGMPGSPMKVRIRGVGSNGNSEPLYVVDGIAVGNLDNLDPSEIASMEVLKDAASSAIYGAQGANGVVMVTTKSGKYNTVPAIEFGMQYGSSTLRNLPKLMDAKQYLTYLNEAGLPNVADPATAEGAPSTDWMKEIVQPATIQRYTLNISGGTEKSTYMVGGAFSNQQGIIGGPKAAFKRYAFRVNSDHQLKSWLKVGERISFSNTIQTSIPQEYGNSVVGGAVMMDPLTPVIYEGDLPDNVQNAIVSEPILPMNSVIRWQ
jgi:TonB-linked SusC/RagA family outer membrane protein